jgi:hypothetical protein
MELTAGDLKFCSLIREKDQALRLFLEENSLADTISGSDWLAYLVGMKSILGNISNDLGFVATLLIKIYLESRFGPISFDAASKPQGAPGIDIQVHTNDGRVVVGELKTTKPYQPGFGANQRKEIIKDLQRLAASTADHRFMFVVDPDAYSALCKPSLASKVPGVEIVDLVTGETFICGAQAGTPKG